MASCIFPDCTASMTLIRLPHVFNLSGELIPASCSNFSAASLNPSTLFHKKNTHRHKKMSMIFEAECYLLELVHTTNQIIHDQFVHVFSVDFHVFDSTQPIWFGDIRLR